MSKRKILAVRSKVKLQSQDQQDLNYWLSKTPQERLAAVTKLVRDSLPKGMKMDRTAYSQRIRK